MDFLIILLLIVSIVFEFIILSKIKKEGIDEKILRQNLDLIQSKIEMFLKDEIGRIREENIKISSQNRQEISKTY